jgi:hypothetical protein
MADNFLEGHAGKQPEIIFFSIERTVVLIIKNTGHNQTGFRAIRLAMIAPVVFLFCFCRDPFFPSIGVPYKVESLRAAPEGVITQLINAYEQQRIDLYEDLFPRSGLFRFYVSPKFQSTYLTRPYANPPESTDVRLQFISANSYYYYWGQDLEIQSHKKLFSQASSIVFSPPPDPGRFHYLVNEKGETTNVEIELTNGNIDITVSIDGAVDQYPVAIEKQVFLLERDSENQIPENRRLWVIRKWYDFGSQ